MNGKRTFSKMDGAKNPFSKMVGAKNPFHKNIGANGAGILKRTWAGILPPPDGGSVPPEMQKHFRPKMLGSTHDKQYGILNAEPTHRTF